MTERMITCHGVELCTESFGDSRHAPILMVMGACASMVWWPDELLQRLANSGRFVLRYDHRDTGRSTTYPPGVTRYSIDDLADDALGVMDAYHLARAHIVGMSLGGLIGQVLALRNPDRVLSLTLIASEKFGDPGYEPPPIDPAIIAHFESAGELNWRDETAATEFLVTLWRLCAGGKRPFERERVRATAVREVGRARSLQSMLNHTALDGAAEWYGRTREVVQPLLVIHGTDDPVVSYRHSLTLVAEAPSARLLTLQDAGHELREGDWKSIVKAILAHTR